MYVEHGYYKEGLINVTKKGQQGEQEIKAMMKKLRDNPPTEIAGSAVARVLDYLNLEEKDLKSGSIKKLEFPSSDVLQFYLDDGSKISVRPSGTEPKIKFYISVNTALTSSDEFDNASKVLDEKISVISEYLKSI
jgi:phosphoglucomutase